MVGKKEDRINKFNNEKSFKIAVIWRIIALVGVALLVFIIAVIIAVPRFNRQAATNNAAGYLQVFREIINQNELSTDEDFLELVKLTDISYLRITIIDLEGTVIADTLNVVNQPFSHRYRPEVIAALAGGVGDDVRRSNTTGIENLYLAQSLTVGDRAVVLRVAVPVVNFNMYIWPLVGIMALVFVIILVGIVLIMPRFTKSITAPISMIKQKLDNIGKPEQSPIALTKHDEINRVLLEIDDISEKLSSALTSYKSEKHKLDLIVDNIDQAIMAIDNSGQIIACNKTAEEYFYFEYTQPVMINAAIKNPILLSNINQAIEKNEYISYDYTRVGGQIYEIRFIPVNLNEISLIVSAQNVTQIRKTSLEKQEFFANASHELNTPLSSVLGYSEMLLKENKFNKTFVQTIHNEASRMKLLISDMFKISELEENKDILDENIELKPIIERVIKALKPKAESKKIKLTVDLSECVIFANVEMITEVATNLIDNAIKYTNNDGAVSVLLKAEGGKAVFIVKDNGIGIPQKDLSRIFERFYRVDKGRSKQEGGIGLGLAIVKHICNYYNAPIKFQSNERIGTEVMVTFNYVHI